MGEKYRAPQLYTCTCFYLAIYCVVKRSQREYEIVSQYGALLCA